MDGDHAIERCAAVTLATLRRVFNELHEHRVRAGRHAAQEPSMVLSGKDCPQQAGVEEVATATLACFPADHPGRRCRASCFSLRRPRAPFGPPSTSTP